MIYKAIFKKEAPTISPAVQDLMHLPNFMIITLFLLFNYRELFNILHLSTILPWIVPMIITNGITAIFYYIFKWARPALPLSLGFFITACTLLLTAIIPNGNVRTVSLFHATILGISQGVSLLPGISRLAFTLTTALWCGIAWDIALFYSLFVEWFLIAAAGEKARIQHPEMHAYLYRGVPWSTHFWLFIASIISYYALKCVALSLETKTIWLFGCYMMLAAAGAWTLKKYIHFMNITMKSKDNT